MECRIERLATLSREKLIKSSFLTQMDLSILDQISQERLNKQSTPKNKEVADKISLSGNKDQAALPVSLRPRALHRRLATESHISPANSFGLVSREAESSSVDKKQKENSNGSAWHEMPRTQLTPELKRDIRLLQLRDTLDPKRFYKKGTISQSLFTKNKSSSGTVHLPTVQIQIGTIVDAPLSRYNRLSNKERTKTISEQVLREENATKYFRQKVDKFAEERTRKYGSSWRTVRNKRIRGSFKKSLRK